MLTAQSLGAFLDILAPRPGQASRTYLHREESLTVRAELGRNMENQTQT